MIQSIEQLKECLELSPEADSEFICKSFNDIARFLIEECTVVYKGRYYAFADIEFYFYNKNHKDIITHPRRSDALQWYVNDFGGIDLNFKSWYEECDCINSNRIMVKKPKLDDNCCFGGILLRELMDCETKVVLKGPLACAELFRMHDALGLCDFPKLVMCKSGLMMKEKTEEESLKGRHNLLSKNQIIKNKVGNILNCYCNGKNEAMLEEMSLQFKAFLDKPYWFKGIAL